MTGKATSRKLRWLAALAACIFAAAALSGCGGAEKTVVVVYTSTDQTQARGILETFQRRTGIEVKSVFDTEAAKTTGLAMKLLAEKDRPQADVFWNNELSRTLMLFEQGVLSPYASPAAADIPDEWKDAAGRWAAFSWRARVIAYNTDQVAPADVPRTLEDLCLPRWRGKVAIANPLFGTTASHAAAIADVLGEDKALDYFRRLRDNGARVYEGNSVVRDAVANGEVPVGLTDTDDVEMGKARGMKIEMVFPDQGQGRRGTFVIPNSVALVAGAPHEAEAKRLIDYLLSPEVEKGFSDPGKGQFPVRPGEGAGEAATAYSQVQPMVVDWAAVASNTTDFSRKANRILTE